jgi:4-hydroxy-3-methylbut-2-enyl diphosphate reductase
LSEVRYYRKGFDNRAEILPILERDYRSGVVEWLRAHGNRVEHAVEDRATTVLLAREFGFCYGVDRAVEYAYETRQRFPERRIYITGEIIHNPWVNRRLSEIGIERIPDAPSPEVDRLAPVTPDDVVLIPAFGIEQPELDRLRAIGAVLVDTTCGSVLNVWKSVGRYAREGYTSIVHGKHDHEETRATCSQVLLKGGAYLVVRDLGQADRVCRKIEGTLSREAFLEEFAHSSSPGFDPDRDLERVGLANQTTMLSSESLEIADRLRRAMRSRYGAEALASHFQSFETICSATQDRQDAVEEVLASGCDVLVVIGGFNSSNTTHLVEIGLSRAPTFHVQGAEDLLSPRWIRHKPSGDPEPVVTGNWMPAGSARIGVTAGASTPNSEIGRAILKILRFRGVPDSFLAQLVSPSLET